MSPAQKLADPRDEALLAACPLVAVPVFGTLAPLAVGQKRLLGAVDGLYLEVRSTALHACLRVSGVPMPYGTVTEFLRPSKGALSSSWLSALAEIALAGESDEVAAGLCLSESGWELVMPPTESSSGSHVTYGDVFDDDRLLIDMHSHGDHDAYFSGTDDASDLSRSGPYIAVVLGKCGSRGTLKSAMRFVCSPFLIPLDGADLTRLGVF